MKVSVFGYVVHWDIVVHLSAYYTPFKSVTFLKTIYTYMANIEVVVKETPGTASDSTM
jgi:hypothetical protein